MHRTERMKRLLDWLSFAPPLESVAKSLVLDHLSSFNPIKSMIWQLNKNDELVLLASYGESEIEIGEIIPGDIWRDGSETVTLALLATAQSPITWSLGNTQAVINLYAKGDLIGCMVVNFAQPVENPKIFNSDAESLSWQISLYLALRFMQALDFSQGGDRNDFKVSAGASQILTERQNSVLHGIVECKTNHQIANDLGYSVSTIRHETMRIFGALHVSDRHEARQKALDLNLVLSQPSAYSEKRF